MEILTKEEMQALAREKKLFDKNGKPVHAFSPAVRPPAAEATPKSELSQVMDVIARTIADGNERTAANIAAQTQELVAAVKQPPVVPSAPARGLEQWKFEFNRKDGTIVSAIATQIK